MSSDDNAPIHNALGQVKWFDARKGFGFIVGPKKQDIFAHYKIIDREGFKILKEGWVVTYDAVFASTGWRATRVVLPPGALLDLPPPAPSEPVPPSLLSDSGTTTQSTKPPASQPPAPTIVVRTSLPGVPASSTDPPALGPITPP